MPSAPRTLWTVGWFGLLVILQYSLRPMLGWRVQADFLVIALLVIAIRSRPAIAAFCGFVLGVVTDSLVPGAFGAGALAMASVGFAASWLKSVFFTENIALNAIFVLAGKWVFDIIYLLAEHRLGGIDLVAQLFWWSPLSAALTAAVGVGVLLVSSPPVSGHRR